MIAFPCGLANLSADYSRWDRFFPRAFAGGAIAWFTYVGPCVLALQVPPESTFLWTAFFEAVCIAVGGFLSMSAFHLLERRGCEFAAFALAVVGYWLVIWFFVLGFPIRETDYTVERPAAVGALTMQVVMT